LSVFLHPGRIVVGTAESVVDPARPGVIYELDANLTLDDLWLSSTFLAAHDRQRREGTLERTLEEEEAWLLAQGIEVLRPSLASR
jgi:hypothetical protein